MVIKSLSVKTLAGIGALVNYISQDKNRLMFSDGMPLVMRQNLRGKSIGAWINEFKANEAFRKTHRKDSNYLYHHILSFDKRDTEHLTPEVMRDLVYKFMDLRSPTGISLGVCHIEKDHIHAHVLQSAISYREGLSTNLSPDEFDAVKIQTQAYQQERYPQLRHSIVNHGKKRAKVRGMDIDDPALRWSKKDMVIHHLKRLLNESSDRNDFFDRAHQESLEVYSRRGMPTGIIADGKKYRFSTLALESDIANLSSSSDEVQKPPVAKKERSEDKEIKSLHEDQSDRQIDTDTPSKDRSRTMDFEQRLSELNQASRGHSNERGPSLEELRRGLDDRE